MNARPSARNAMDCVPPDCTAPDRDTILIVEAFVNGAAMTERNPEKTMGSSARAKVFAGLTARVPEPV